MAHIGNRRTSDLRSMNAREFVRTMLDTIGLGYHPDTRAADYVYTASGSRMFSKASAKAIDDITGMFESQGVDLCEIALNMIKADEARATRLLTQASKDLHWALAVDESEKAEIRANLTAAKENIEVALRILK